MLHKYSSIRALCSSSSRRAVLVRFSSTVPDTAAATQIPASEEQEHHQQQQEQEQEEHQQLHTSSVVTSEMKQKTVSAKAGGPNFNDYNLESMGQERSEKPKYNLGSLPRVPPTSNISHNLLYNDLLMNNYMPLLSPVKKNHTVVPKKKKTSSVLESLENFKSHKQRQRGKNLENSKYYNTYLNKENLKLPYNSIFCNTALNTQQHNLEMFNLPLNYLEKLKPFKLINKPGEEYYRDDLIVLSKIELEQSNLSKREKAQKKAEKDGKILDFEEFFGFK